MPDIPTDAATDTPTEADIALIQSILPHRYPFLLVDRVVDIVAHESATGIKAVTMNEPQFQGHFPGVPVFPGVMIVEAMAQTAGVLVGIGHGVQSEPPLIYFMGMDGVKFRRKVCPGDVLRMHVRITRGKLGGKVWRFDGRADVDGEVAAEAQFMAMLDLKGASG